MGESKRSASKSGQPKHKSPNTTIKREGSKRSQIEASLREYQAILSAAEEVAKIGSWRWDLHTQKVTWSDEMFRLFGVEREGFDGDVNRIIAERIHPDDMAAVSESNRMVLEEATPVPMSYRIVLPDGTVRTVWAQGKLVHDSQGRPQALTGFIQDITERVRAEKKVLQMKRLYATLSQVNQIIVRVKDREELFGTICEVAIQFGEFSLAWIGLLDDETGDVRLASSTGPLVKQLPLPSINIYRDDDKGSLAFQALKTGRVVTSNNILTDERISSHVSDRFQNLPYRAAAVIPLRLRGKAIGALALLSQEEGVFHDDDEINLLEEMALDIAFALDNMENEAERRSAEQRIAHQAYLLENINDAVLATDDKFQITSWNRSAEKMYGYSQEEVLGLTVQQVIRSEISEEQRTQIVHELQENGGYRLEVKQHHRDGHLFWVEGSTFTLRNANGDVTGYVSINRDISERKRAEAEILSISRFPQENPNPVMRFSTEGNLLYANYSSQILLDFWNCTIGAKPPADIQTIISRTIQTGLLIETDVSCEEKVFLLDFTPITESGYVNCYGRDITESREAEQALQKSEERLRLSLHAANQGLYDLNVQTGDAIVNREYAEMLGYDPDSFVETNAFWIERLHPDDRETTAKAYREYINGELPEYRVEFRQRAKDGNWKWILSLGSVVEYDADGNPLRMLGTHTDITERKKAEEALKRNEAVLRLFVEHSPASIAMFDRDMRYIVASRRYISDYRLTLDDVIGLSHYEVFPEIPEHWKEIHRRCLNGSVERAEEDPFPREDGTLDWVRWEIRPWYEESGIIGGIILFSEVITERKKVQDELRTLNQQLEERVAERTVELSHANRAKDEFLANMSHELRTPLNTVLGLSESLLEQRRGPLNEKQLESVELIASSGHHLLGLINDILEVSKIEAGKLQIRPTEVHVKEICDSSLNFIRELSLKKKINVEFRGDETLSTFDADPQRVKQILINLLTNAVKFTPEGGRITLDVHASMNREQIIFSVTDTGIGIAPDDIKKLFTPFSQLDSSLARQYAGTGLGLTLVQKLTDLHGGSVQVESEIGKGSRFTISLPLTLYAGPALAAQGELVPVIQAPAPSGTVHPRGVILLAEDNEINSQMMYEYLEAQGYSIIVAQNGEEVLEKAAELRPDIILMDIQMPKMDGLEATRLLRQDPRFTSTPIIALTALAMPGDKERCLEAGATEYLSKPVGLRQLRELIQSLIEPKS